MESLPSQSLSNDELRQAAVTTSWPPGVDREWALGGADGRGVRVCILDSGIEARHPLVGDVQRSVTVVCQRRSKSGPLSPVEK